MTAKSVEVCTELLIDGLATDCVVSVSVQPGFKGSRDEEGFGPNAEEVLSVCTDDDAPIEVPRAKWPATLLEDVEEEAVQAAAEDEGD